MDENIPPPSPEEQEQRLQEERITRRTLMMKLGMLLNGAVALMIATPIVRYLLAPARKDEYLQWVALGNISDYKPGETVLVSYENPFGDSWDGDTQKVPAYVRRVNEQNFTVFAVNCAHLNCPVRWFAESQLFMCPCHGGVYYANGDRASGPPERGLFQYEWKVDNRKLYIKAGQMPTLSNRAQLIREIKPCSGTNGSMPG